MEKFLAKLWKDRLNYSCYYYNNQWYWSIVIQPEISFSPEDGQLIKSGPFKEKFMAELDFIKFSDAIEGLSNGVQIIKNHKTLNH